jgi:hypothetical protein
MVRAGGEARMKTPLVVVSASLTLAIILLAGFLIATQAHGHSSDNYESDDHHFYGHSTHDHLWKMKNAPAAMNAKPIA